MTHVLYIISYVVVALADAIIAMRARARGGESGRLLSVCMSLTAAFTLIYLISVTVPEYWVATSANLASFCFMDVMLVYLLAFFLSVMYGKLRKKRFALGVVRVFMVLAVADMVSVALNPIFGHVATYTFIGMDHVPHFMFEAGLGYAAHLVLCYTMLLFGFATMFGHSMRIPRIYRGPLHRILACAVAVVLFNFSYVWFFSADAADVTILAYSILGFAMYISVFVYGNRDALKSASLAVLNVSARPVVVFDYKDDLFHMNEQATELFADYLSKSSVCTREEFIGRLGISDMPESTDGTVRFYWTPSGQGNYSYICDYQEIRGNRGKHIASFLVFTNNTLSIDKVTGYLTESYFIMHKQELAAFDSEPVVLSACDINQLGLINNTLGYERGNDALALQANTMRSQFPENALFVRLQDAKLAVLTYGLEPDEIKTILNEVNALLAGHHDFNIRLKMDYAVCPIEEGETLTDTAERAVSVLETRKLLDEESRHSSTIESLTAMLAECDGETEGHVRRTRILGDGLAYEMGLSDFERDQLSLLCLFHDIGKVGIPSHILNKPAHLTDAERAIMQDHVHKGYRIARATAGLEIVAEPILHHHENWDGSGYPDGLQHEAIPILSRIISVVDAYDAMVSDRPYHAGISTEEACRELRRCAGVQFDPYIVDAFVRMVSEKAVEEDALTGDTLITPNNTASTNTSDGKDVIPSKVVMLSPVNFATYKLDRDMRISDISPEFEELTGYTAYDVENLHMTQSDLLFEEDRESYWIAVNQLLENSDMAFLEHRICRKDGTGRYVYCIGRIDRGIRPACTRVVVTDITDSLSVQRQMNIVRNRAMMSLRRLEESVQLDPLTGLLNQAAFRKSCERDLLDVKDRCALIMLDIDDFKDINDTYGHPKGDRLLVAIAEALSSAVGSQGTAGRVGGDEFACFLRFDSGVSLSQIHEGVESFWTRFGQMSASLPVPATFSAGAAWYEGSQRDYAELYERADAALYCAKRAGKNRLAVDDGAQPVSVSSVSPQ